MHLLVPCAFLLATLTSAAPTKNCNIAPITFCRVQTVPATASEVCNGKGTVSKPQYLEEFPCKTTSFTQCRNACIDGSACKSFAYTASTGQCALYGKSIKSQGYRPSAKSNTIVNDAKCFEILDDVPFQAKVPSGQYSGLYFGVNHVQQPFINDYLAQLGGVGAASFTLDPSASCTLEYQGMHMLPGGYQNELLFEQSNSPYTCTIVQTGKLAGSDGSLQCSDSSGKDIWWAIPDSGADQGNTGIGLGGSVPQGNITLPLFAIYNQEG